MAYRNSTISKILVYSLKGCTYGKNFGLRPTKLYLKQDFGLMPNKLHPKQHYGLRPIEIAPKAGFWSDA